MSKLISDEDYHTFFRIVGELAATKGMLAQMENELEYQRELTKYAIELRAAPIKEQPDFAQHSKGEICSNDICDYCIGRDFGCAIEPPEDCHRCEKFVGRKLSPIA